MGTPNLARCMQRVAPADVDGQPIDFMQQRSACPNDWSEQQRLPPLGCRRRAKILWRQEIFGHERRYHVEPKSHARPPHPSPLISSARSRGSRAPLPPPADATTTPLAPPVAVAYIVLCAGVAVRCLGVVSRLDCQPYIFECTAPTTVSPLQKICFTSKRSSTK